MGKHMKELEEESPCSLLWLVGFREACHSDNFGKASIWDCQVQSPPLSPGDVKVHLLWSLPQEPGDFFNFGESLL